MIIETDGGLINEKDILQLNEVVLLSFFNQNNFVDNIIPFKEVKCVLHNLGLNIESDFKDNEVVKLDSDLLDAKVLIKGSCQRTLPLQIQKEKLCQFLKEACRLTKTKYLVAYTGEIYCYT